MWSTCLLFHLLYFTLECTLLYQTSSQLGVVLHYVGVLKSIVLMIARKYKPCRYRLSPCKVVVTIKLNYTAYRTSGNFSVENFSRNNYSRWKFFADWSAREIFFTRIIQTSSPSLWTLRYFRGVVRPASWKKNGLLLMRHGGKRICRFRPAPLGYTACRAGTSSYAASPPGLVNSLAR